jgi:hypothetical protein
MARPEFLEDGLTQNPFRDGRRRVGRLGYCHDFHRGPAQLAGHASYRGRLAAAIAALASKRRLANILALTWQDHIDPDLRFIAVHRTKRWRRCGGPRSSPSASSSG